MITTEQIKELRDATGISVMQCKKALEEAEGNMEKALLILKKKSTEIASKKSDREVKDGLIVVKNSFDKAAIVALQCETDFVARNGDFVNLTNTLAEIALKEGVETMKAKSEELINQVIQKVGENIKLKDAAVVEGKNLGIYVHNGKVGVIVSLEGGNADVARDIAMHVAAMKPEYVSRESIDPKMLDDVTALFIKEVEEMGKPEEIKKKILAGKVDAYFKERTLLDQAFIKDSNETISGLLKKSGDAKVKKFMRLSLV